MEQILPVIISSIIAFIGVIISVRESSKRSDDLIKAEIEKIKSGIQQDYATKLLEKRIEVYPKLYSIISDFIKLVQFGKVTTDIIQKLKSDIEAWDSNNALFLSAGSTGTIYDFRKFLFDEAINKSDEELQKANYLKTLRDRAGDVEVVLKNDIGIYKVEYSDIEKEIKTFRDHKKVSMERKK